MKKRKKQKCEIVSQNIMAKYKRYRKITFDGFWMVILLSFVIIPNQRIRQILLPILLLPILAVAITAARMYSKFPAKTRKSLKLGYLPISPIEHHPYAAVGYVLFMQIVFVFLALNVIA